MCEIIKKLKELNQKQSAQPLQQYLLDVDDEKLIRAIKNELPGANFVTIWDCVLQKLNDNDRLQHKRFKIVLAVLREIERVQLPSAHNDTILTRLIMDLQSFTTEHLVEVASYFVESVQVGKFTGNGFKELMPNLLNVIMERDNVEHNNTEMSGIEYKKQLIGTLLMLEWSPNIIITLTSMFIEMPLSADEHLQVVSKFCQYMKKLTPQEIPAFVYHLLNLCQNQNGRIVFIQLQQYFAPLYNEISTNYDTGSESTVDMIESASNIDLFEAENTVLYHIHQAANLGRNSINDYLNCLKNLTKAPEYVLHPFHLTVLLSISKIMHFEDKVTEILKSGVSRMLHEENKKAHSLWLREMVPDIGKMEPVFAYIIENGVKGRQLVLEGLVHFGFILLNVGAMLGRDPIAEKQWRLGIFILMKVVKKKNNVTPFVVKTLSDQIFTMQNVTQHIECVYFMSRRLTLYMLENQNGIKEMMENLLQVSGSVAGQLLEAIVPIAKISVTIRDYLIVLLRKALFSRSIETRQMAVMGFLKLLKNLKFSNLGALSQSSISSSFSSGHSILTQISLNTQSQSGRALFSNEELCFQVLNILKCCFMQQIEVRAQFYEGLYDAVCKNPDLGIPVLKTVWLHFGQFYVNDKDSLPPLKFSKISTVKDLEVVAQEPLGLLIYTISMIISKVMETGDDENYTVKNFIDELDSLCDRMTNCELIHFELDDGTDLLDVLPESQQKLLVLKEVLVIFEALIAYKIITWGPTTENNDLIVNRLFQAHSRFVHFSKNLMKPKKAESKKKKQDDSLTQQSVVTIKKDSSNQKKNFKMPDTILTYPVVIKAVQMLYSVDVPWTTIAKLTSVRTKQEIHRHILQAAIQLVQNTKFKHIAQTDEAKIYFDHLTTIGSVLFERCIERLYDFADFDATSAVLAADCFHQILNTICGHFKNNLVPFLHAVSSKDSKDLIQLLTHFVEVYQKLLDLDDDDSNDSELKKLPLIIINTLNLLCNQIPSENNVLALQVLEWMKNFIDNKTLSKQEAPVFVSLLFETHLRYKNTLNLIENLSKAAAKVMGTIQNEETFEENFKLVNESTVHSVVLSLCNTNKTLLDEINWMIARIRYENYALTYPAIESIEKRRDSLRSKERAVCCQLCLVASILTTLSVLMVQPGPIWENILKNLVQLYNTLNSLTKYFVQHSSKNNLSFQAARFEQLVKLTGKQLNPNVYNLILYVEESQKPDADVTQNKKKSVDCNVLKSRILRETKSIPKVIYEMEQFSKSIIQLSKKTGVDLSRYVGQGTVRDFRIKDLKNIVKETESSISNLHSTGDDSNMSVDASGEEDEIVDSDEESSSPPSKKQKV